MTNYWIVGATVCNQDLSDYFIKHGFWFADKDTAQPEIAKIQKGDRIAIKKMRGSGATTVDIKVIGVVSDIGVFDSMDFRMVFVNWIDLRGEERQAPFSGWAGTIHGPYGSDNNVVASVFGL